ncbi:MAG: hypothetical protein NZ891_05385, partial [bacterium]|nr:hypothetical protein [bacterium]MDW8164155.1 hypothetical protein [Candidatus Omnitrophota bacterium]
MEKKRFAFKEVPVEIRCALFKGKEGINEYHLSFSPIKRESFQMQLKWIYEAYIKTLEILNIEEETCVFRRFFCSDLYNQLIYLKEMDFSNPENNSNLVGISLICQPPGPFARISMWAYHVKDNKKNIEKEKMGNTISLKRDNLIHNWTTGLFNNKLDSVYEQTKNIIETYLNLLKEKNMKLSENVIRTWFFLKNIDTDY